MNRKTYMRDIYSKYRITAREKIYGFLKYDKNLCNYISTHVPKNGKLLEVAIGTGYPFGDFLRKSGYLVYGIDISPDLIEKCKQLYPDINSKVGDAEKIDYPDDYFDCTYCFHSTWYLPNLNNAIDEMLRVTRLGGLVIFDIQNRNNKEIAMAYRKRLYAHLGTKWTINYAKNIVKLILCRIPMHNPNVYEVPAYPQTIYKHLKKRYPFNFDVMVRKEDESLETAKQEANLRNFGRLVFVIKKTKKTLIMSEWAPPMNGGGPAIMRALLRHFPPGSISILTSEACRGDANIAIAHSLNCQYHFSCRPAILRRFKEKRSMGPVLELCEILSVVFKGFFIIIREKVDSILATTYGGYEVAALILHKLTGKKLFVYLFDIYEESQLTRWGKIRARFIEPWLLKSSEKVFVMSGALQEHLNSKYKGRIKTVFFPHALDTEFDFGKKTQSVVFQKKFPFEIVYTGNIYDAHYDSILNMVKVVDSFPKGEVVFKIYTPRSPESLVRRGICGENVFFDFISFKKMPTVLQAADVLFLPFAFDNPYPMVIRTASPGKIAEYLAAGRPILVHAPPYAYINHYAKTDGFGLVVDKSDPQILREAVSRLREDENLRSQLGRNAYAASLKHNGKELSSRLQRILFT